MSKISIFALSLVIITHILFLKFDDMPVQDGRMVDSTFSGKDMSYNVNVYADSEKKLIWNNSNELYKETMEFPKGNLVTPNYLMIPKNRNVGVDPFTKRFSSKALMAAHKESYRVMKEISRQVTNRKLDKTNITVTCYAAPDGLIKEVEFITARNCKLQGNHFEELEREIKSNLRFVTESDAFKSGNYIKLSATWEI
ncbi:hypothetical protein LZD49_33355 [Dyadobacter sp. CY261]|uniref:hypothetical protein n=1 Tax=Dyadobacter sp. CY261 TaxID=2907203 RepID=UPI001F30A990|nr:hypothetical protein [Dyadobacter sp. CY261]MCF0075414.1 hypothetical protein [Dyadobacter sp. CY261]